MSPPLHHDYIGPSLDNLKETELRLGPPGSPDHANARKPPVSLTLDLLPAAKCTTAFVSGAKRGWNFSSSAPAAGSDADLAKTDAAAVKDAAAAAAKGQGQGQGQGQDNKAPAAKAQVVGWPPIRSYRKNTMATNPVKNKEDAESKQGLGCLYVKVSMDGAPYLRKVDLKTYCNYKDLSSALEKMFSGFTIGQCGGQGIPSRDGLSESCLMDLLNGSEYVLTYEDKDGDWMLVGDVPWEMFTLTCRRLRIMKGSDAIGLAPRAMEKCKNRN